VKQRKKWSFDEIGLDMAGLGERFERRKKKLAEMIEGELVLT